MKVKSESEVAQLCPTLSDPMDCSLPGCPVHGIFQARVLEWGAIAFSNDSLKGLNYRQNKPTKKLQVCGVSQCPEHLTQYLAHTRPLIMIY